MARILLNQFARLIPFVMIAWLLVACSAVDAPPEPTETPTAAAAETVSTSSAETAAEVENDDDLSGLRRLTIAPDQSEARFLVDEVLLGEDKTVVGVTSKVTGTIEVDPADPASAQLSTIIIDARDFTTDSSRRNRSIQRQVLRSVLDENRFITFEPTAIDGLPATVVIGEPFSFTVTGDLTVVGESRPETFDLTVTASSPTEISGTGTTVIRYDEYGISIPSVPAVARVDEEVRLELAFVASAAE